LPAKSIGDFVAKTRAWGDQSAAKAGIYASLRATGTVSTFPFFAAPTDRSKIYDLSKGVRAIASKTAGAAFTSRLAHLWEEEEHARDLHDHDQPLGPREVLDRLDFLLVRQPRRRARLQRHRRRGAVRHAVSPSCASSSSEGSSGCSSATSSASSSVFGSGFGWGAFGVGVSAAGGGAAGFVAGTGATGFGAGAGVAGLAAAGATATGLGGSGAGGVVDTTRPSFTTNPCFVTIVIASTGQTIAHFSQPTQFSSMMMAFRDVYEYSGSANFRSTMPIDSNAQLSKQCVQPMQISSSTTASVPRPRMYSCVRTLNPCLYRSFASCRFICRTVR